MPRLSIGPANATLDHPMTIEVSDVMPGARVRIRLRNESLKAEATADFLANGRGSLATMRA